MLLYVAWVLRRIMLEFVFVRRRMERRIDDMGNAVAANKPIALPDTKVFRQFLCLLAPEDDVLIQKLIVEERRNRKNFLENRMIKNDTDTDDVLCDDEPQAKAKAKAGDDIVLSEMVSKVTKSACTAGSSQDAPTVSLEPKEKKGKLAGSPDMDARMALFLPNGMAANKSEI